MKTKTASVRLPKEMFEEIDELCDGIGCSRNDWIKDTLKDRLREENNETKYPEPTKESTKKESKPKESKPEIGTIKTTNDSKYRLKNIQDNDVQLWEEVEEPKEVQNARIVLEPEPKQLDGSNNPPYQMTYYNGKLLPFTKRYNI